MSTDLEILSSFNRRTEKLINSPLFDKVLNGTVRCGINWKAGHPIEIESTEFDQTELESFILTARLLVQDNEPISLRKIGELYEGLAVPKERKEAIRAARQKLNSFLDSRMIFNWDDGPATYRILFETIMYGELAHENREKAKNFAKWTADDFLKPNVWTLFLFCLQEIVCAATFIRVQNIKTLKEKGAF